MGATRNQEKPTRGRPEGAETDNSLPITPSRSSSQAVATLQNSSTIEVRVGSRLCEDARS